MPDVPWYNDTVNFWGKIDAFQKGEDYPEVYDVPYYPIFVKTTLPENFTWDDFQLYVFWKPPDEDDDDGMPFTDSSTFWENNDGVNRYNDRAAFNEKQMTWGGDPGPMQTVIPMFPPYCFRTAFSSDTAYIGGPRFSWTDDYKSPQNYINITPYIQDNKAIIVTFDINWTSDAVNSDASVITTVDIATEYTSWTQAEIMIPSWSIGAHEFPTMDPCQYCLLVTEIVGQTPDICDKTITNSVCDDAWLDEACNNGQTGTLEFAQCQEYCAENDGNCSDHIGRLCESYEWESEFVSSAEFASSSSPSSIDIKELFCGCYLHNDEYNDWYQTEIINSNLIPASGSTPADMRCIYNNCVLSEYKFDNWGSCPSTTFCVNIVDAENIVIAEESHLVLDTACGEGSDTDTDSDPDSHTHEPIWDQFMALDFAGDHTPYIITAAFGFLLLFVAYFLI